MSDSTAHFARLLRVELQDLLDDITALESQLRARFDAAEISAYVYRENDALLLRELETVRGFLRYLEQLDTSVFASPGQLALTLDETFGHQVRQNAGPQAVLPLVQRKMRKVSEFMRSMDS